MVAKTHAGQISHESGGSSDLYGGIALGIAAILALVIANSPLGPAYQALLGTTAEIRVGALSLAKDLEHWISDGLMAIFFMLAALEIKREALAGELKGLRKAALPAIAALGGAFVPALLYCAFNLNDPVALKGWAIPCATDIAFAVGICALLGRSVPPSLRSFLLALAIIDDLLSIVVIAVFYSGELSLVSLALAGLGLLGLLLLNLLDVRKAAPFVLVGLFTWVCVLKSGVHATLAGVAVGLAMPMTRHEGEGSNGESLLEHAEHALKPWVSFAIVPAFAFANAGVPLAGLSLASLSASIPLGIIAGLFLGKQLGVFVCAILAIRLGIAVEPAGTTKLQLYATAILTGVGFTMSLFIGTLAFDDEQIMMKVKLGVLAGSVLAGLAAAILFRLAARRASPLAATT